MALTSTKKMKRGRQREGGSFDEEPLSKRINNLHLDAPVFPTPNFTSNQLNNYNLNANPQQQAADFDVYNNNNNNYINYNNINYVKDACMLQQSQPLAHGLMPAITIDGNAHGYDSLQKMIENRELPESLNDHYPSNNPTDNSYYYNFNRVLHAVHLERLRRHGKI